MFGYRLLGFGSGSGKKQVDFDFLIVASGGAGDTGSRGAGGAGGHRTSFPGGTKITLEAGPNSITVGAAPANRTPGGVGGGPGSDSSIQIRSEEHTSELQSQSTISYAVFCLKKKRKKPN